MIMLRPPFKASDVKQLYKKVVAVDYPPLSNSRYSTELTGLVKLMLQSNPLVRPSCNQMLQMSPFMKNVDQSI